MIKFFRFVPPSHHQPRRSNPANKLVRVRDTFKPDRPVYEAFKTFCAKWGDDVIEYQEFKFWYMPFYAGNFDLEHDRSKDVQLRSINDLPMEIAKQLLARVGNDSRFTLRHVCKSFRAVVDLWIPDYKTIRIQAKHDRVQMKIDDNEMMIYAQKPPKVLNFSKLAVDDLLSILKHPELKLEHFEITGPKATEFTEKLDKKMKAAKVQGVHIESATILLSGVKILKYSKAATLKTLHIELDKHSEKAEPRKKQIEEMNKMRQCRKTENITFGKSILKFDPKFLIPSLLKCHQVTYDCVGIQKEGAEAIVKAVLENLNYKKCVVEEGKERGLVMHTLHETRYCRMIGYHWNLIRYHAPDGRQLLDIGNNGGDITFKKM